MSVTDAKKNNERQIENIFSKLFDCRVSELDYRSKDDIAFFGMPHTGIQEYDTMMTNALTLRMLPISKMADLFANGAAVRIVKLSDTKIIYEHIVDYLSLFEKQTFGVNNKSIPTEDLIKLDKFGAALYPHAKPHFNTVSFDNPFGRMVADLTKSIGIPVTEEPKVLTELPEEHNSFSSAFKKLPGNKIKRRWDT